MPAGICGVRRSKLLATLAEVGAFSSAAGTVLRWEVFSSILGVCLTFAFGVLGAAHYKASRKWFWAAALLAWTKLIVWGIATSMTSLQRIVIAALLGASVTVVLVETLRWIDRLQKPAVSPLEKAALQAGSDSRGSARAAVKQQATVQDAFDKDSGAAYCYLMVMPVHDYRTENRAALAIVNPHHVPVYGVSITIRSVDPVLRVHEEPSSGNDSMETTLTPGTVAPGLSATSLKLPPGTYSIAIDTKAGNFSETLVIARKNGKLSSDFSLTRLSDSQLLIPGKALLQR